MQSKRAITSAYILFELLLENQKMYQLNRVIIGEKVESFNENLQLLQVIQDIGYKGNTNDQFDNRMTYKLNQSGFIGRFFLSNLTIKINIFKNIRSE